jgi:RNA polymerase sigma factor (sigma-70 family)
LYQEGLLGALDALRTYDPSHGVVFTTYALPRVAGRIIDYIRSTSVYSRNQYRRAKLGEIELPKVYSLEAMQEKWDSDSDNRSRYEPYSLDPPPQEDAESVLSIIRKRGIGLRADERQVVLLHYVSGQSFREVGQSMGRSQAWASQKMNAILDACDAVRRTGGARKPRPHRRKTGSRLQAIYDAMGIKILSYAGGKKSVVMVCPHCKQQRSAGQSLLKYWRSLGYVPRCRNGTQHSKKTQQEQPRGEANQPSDGELGAHQAAG